jgi:hypothetical protein
MTELTTIQQAQAPAWSPREAPLPIRSADDYRAVAAELLVVKQFSRQVEAWFKPLKQQAKAAWDALVKAEREALAPARAWEEKCKQAMVEWDRQQEELRRAEERRRAEEARKAEEERRLARAAALEAQALAEGDEAKLAQARALIAAPIETAPVFVEKATPQVDGISYREDAVGLGPPILRRSPSPTVSLDELAEPDRRVIEEILRRVGRG